MICIEELLVLQLQKVYLVLFWACNVGFSRSISPSGDSAPKHNGPDRFLGGSSNYLAPGSPAWSHFAGISSVHCILRHLNIFQCRKPGRLGLHQTYQNKLGSLLLYRKDHLALCKSIFPSCKQHLKVRIGKVDYCSPVNQHINIIKNIKLKLKLIIIINYK